MCRRNQIGRFSCRLLLTFVLAVSCAPRQALGQELIGMLGAVRHDPSEHSHALGLSYVHNLGRYFAASLTYLNEGHVPAHHRDGFTAQLWARAHVSPRLSLAAGAGPYRYFDTVSADTETGHIDKHGWGRVFSLAATWRGEGRRFYELRYNRVLLREGLDSSLLTAGIGYRLDRDAQAAAHDPRSIDSKNDELTVFAGRTIVNSFESERSSAKSLEYRRTLGPLARGSVAWLDEGNAGILRRKGVAAELWLEPSFSGDRFTLGAGAGPYLAVDDRREDRVVVSALLSVAASYHLGRHVLARLMWHRVMTYYHRDSDVILLGLGYRF